MVLKDQLPPETTFVSASNSGTYDPATHSVTWNIGEVQAKAPTQTLQLVARVKTATSATLIINYSTITCNEWPPYTSWAETTVTFRLVGCWAFPCRGYTPYTAPVSHGDGQLRAGADPHSSFTSPATLIKAFNGEIGEKQYGGLTWTPTTYTGRLTRTAPAPNSSLPPATGVRPLNYINDAFLSYAGNPGYHFPGALGLARYWPPPTASSIKPWSIRLTAPVMIITLIPTSTIKTAIIPGTFTPP